MFWYVTLALLAWCLLGPLIVLFLAPYFTYVLLKQKVNKIGAVIAAVITVPLTVPILLIFMVFWLISMYWWKIRRTVKK